MQDHIQENVSHCGRDPMFSCGNNGTRFSYVLSGFKLGSGLAMIDSGASPSGERWICDPLLKIGRRWDGIKDQMHRIGFSS